MGGAEASMDDEWFETGEGGASRETATEWLDAIAETEGLSREETLDRLVSAYWQLNEMVQLVREPDGSPEQSPSVDELRDGRRQESAAPTPLRETLTEFEERLERLEETVDELRDGGVGGRSRPELDQTLQELQRQTATLEQSFEDLNGRYERLLQTKVSTQEFSDYATRANAFRDAVEERHDSLHDRVQSEFEHIRTILEHLIERAEMDDDRLETELRGYRETLGEVLAERERLLELTTEASRRGIVRADCAHCGHLVDLGLIQSPACPQCERTFARIESEDKLFGLVTEYRLETTDESTGRSTDSLDGKLRG